MIPPECEKLLDKSQAWGFQPDGRWQPQTPAQAQEVAQFFGSYFLVPESSSRYYEAWLQEQEAGDEAAAKARLDLLARAQSCDSTLALTFLDGLLAYHWPSRQAKKAAGDALLKFVLNQQARVEPLEARAVSLYATEQAKKKGFVAGPSAPLTQLRVQMERKRAAIAAATGGAETSLAMAKRSRQEFELSQDVREQLSRFLPLP
jgi:hypothetical protein